MEDTCQDQLLFRNLAAEGNGMVEEVVIRVAGCASKYDKKYYTLNKVFHTCMLELECITDTWQNGEDRNLIQGALCGIGNHQVRISVAVHIIYRDVEQVLGVLAPCVLSRLVDGLVLGEFLGAIPYLALLLAGRLLLTPCGVLVREMEVNAEVQSMIIRHSVVVALLKVLHFFA